MVNVIAIGLQLYKIFKIMRVSFLWHALYLFCNSEMYAL